jgi:hypothetical protein
MRFGEIIKKSWNITWRYRALWVLGVFAGITGGGGAGGGGGNSFRGLSSPAPSSSGQSPPFNPDTFRTLAERWLPMIVAGAALLVVIGIAFAIVSIGARGGLIWAVNEIEEGRRPKLGHAWDAGFSRFWSLFALGLMIQLPIVVAALALGAAILVPIVGPLLRGATPHPAAVLVPICGGLAIGVPVLLVAGLILGIMYITGIRFIMLEGAGAVHAVGESWRAFRARFADHAVMYLINLGLNIAAGFALAIPIVIITFAMVVPAAVAGASGHWGSLAVVIAVLALLLIVLGFAYAAIWGTFTSALWTIFYRRLTGREVVVRDASPTPAVGHPAPLAPDVPDYAPVTPTPFGYPAPRPAPQVVYPPEYPPEHPPGPAAPGVPPTEPQPFAPPTLPYEPPPMAPPVTPQEPPMVPPPVPSEPPPMAPPEVPWEPPHRQPPAAPPEEPSPHA